MSDIEETNMTQVAEQNARNVAAGLPPVSTNLTTPDTIPEDSLGPIYPKMTDIVAAVWEEKPIPKNEYVGEIERKSSDLRSDTAQFRSFIDNAADLFEESENASVSAGTASAAVQAAQDAQQASASEDAAKASADEVKATADWSKITAGTISYSSTSSLADWKNGSDATYIEGNKIIANKISVPGIKSISATIGVASVHDYQPATREIVKTETRYLLYGVIANSVVTLGAIVAYVLS